MREVLTVESFDLNVCGVRWEVIVATPEDRPLLKSCLGYADRSSKRIYIKDLRREPDERDMERLDLIMAETIRHELVHAWLFECGMMDEREFDHERIADWLQMKIHPLYEAILDGERRLSDLISSKEEPAALCAGKEDPATLSACMYGKPEGWA